MVNMKELQETHSVFRKAIEGIGNESFRFKFVMGNDLDGTQFTAQLDLLAGLYIVAWLDRNNINSITYSVEDVIYNVKKGIWKMINNEGGK